MLRTISQLSEAVDFGSGYATDDIPKKLNTVNIMIPESLNSLSTLDVDFCMQTVAEHAQTIKYALHQHSTDMQTEIVSPCKCVCLG